MPRSFFDEFDEFCIFFALASAVFSIGYLLWNSLWLILFFIIIVNVITIMVYSHDKKVSMIRGHGRVPEGFLILCSFLGGWIGAILAQQLFRHKTRKIKFQFLFIISIMINMFVVYVKRDDILSWNNIFEL